MAKTCSFVTLRGKRCRKRRGRKHGGFGPFCRTHFAYFKGRARTAAWGAGGYGAMRILDFISEKGLDQIWHLIVGKAARSRTGGLAVPARAQARPGPEGRSRAVVKMKAGR